MAHPAQISASCSCSREATTSEKPCGYGEAIQLPSRFSAAWARADRGGECEASQQFMFSNAYDSVFNACDIEL